MGRPPRLVYPGALYHAMARGNNRQSVFQATMDYNQLLRLMLYVKAKFPFRLYGYCLMTNHIHLLLEPCAGAVISNIMQLLLRTYAAHYNSTYGTEGHVWKNRFVSRVIDSELYALRALIYIECNPVKAGLCARPEQYPWSSARTHLLGAPNPCLDPYAPFVAAERWQAYQELMECRSVDVFANPFLRRRGRPRNPQNVSDTFSRGENRRNPSYPQMVSDTFLGGGDG